MDDVTIMEKQAVYYDVSRLTEHDIYLFKEGNHFRLYDKLGAHPIKHEGISGVLFAVWAPNAARVSVVGDFNGWDPGPHPLRVRGDGSGIWEGFIPNIGKGERYKYRIHSHHRGHVVDKGDPYAQTWEAPPATASKVWELDYPWGDGDWMSRRGEVNRLDAPQSIYEVHLGSWRRMPEERYRSLTYLELADWLPGYVSDIGFTHVEFMPPTEHPFYGSWGYQTTGFFAPSARYGTPEDFMTLIDRLHQYGIGVILDWVPSHFPSDEHGLSYFDGTNLFEHEDPKQGYHPEWNSYIFNYGRNEVRAFLGSSALFWLEKYHIDGLRVDAVASMLYLDYARNEGEWIPNRFGGHENLEAIDFLRKLNEAVYRDYPDVQTIAEESTAWPMVSRPTYLGGLGFGLKWNMGWMHDTLSYFSKDPIYRRHHHGQLTFSLLYAFHENFVLPFSHDEVVHGKGSMIGKMPGDDWQKFANLRALYGYQFGHPGKKLLFMGSEFGQWQEWDHEQSLQWHLLEHTPHQGLLHWVRDLNRLYRSEPALHQRDFDPAGFEWIDCNNWEDSTLSFIRKGEDGGSTMLVVCNFTPVPRSNYRVGVPQDGWWHEVLNSDATNYGGSGWGNMGGLQAAPVGAYGRPFSINLNLPPLSVLFFRHEG